MISYCLGFPFSASYSHVSLIQKNRPDWQAGKFNGFGGKIKPREDALAAMIREFREDSGVLTTIDQWRRIGTMGGEGWGCEVFAMQSDLVFSASSTTDEQVYLFEVTRIRSNPPMYVDPNVALWMHLALLQGPVIKDLNLAY